MLIKKISVETVVVCTFWDILHSTRNIIICGHCVQSTLVSLTLWKSRLLQKRSYSKQNSKKKNKLVCHQNVEVPYTNTSWFPSVKCNYCCYLLFILKNSAIIYLKVCEEDYRWSLCTKLPSMSNYSWLCLIIVSMILFQVLPVKLGKRWVIVLQFYWGKAGMSPRNKCIPQQQNTAYIWIETDPSVTWGMSQSAGSQGVTCAASNNRMIVPNRLYLNMQVNAPQTSKSPDSSSTVS